MRSHVLLALLLSSARASGDGREHTCARQDVGQEAIFECGGSLITAVEFASFGTPRGSCNADSGVVAGAGNGNCHAANTVAAVEDRCLGQSTCMFTVTSELFGSYHCTQGDGSRRWLMAQLKCGDDVQPVQPRGAGFGWQFIMLVFLVFGLYLGLGIAYKVKREGAKLNSLEAIPHVEMWKELPALVRDGVIFSVDTIKSKGRPSYDSVGSL